MNRQSKAHRTTRLLALLCAATAAMVTATAEVEVSLALGDTQILANQAQKGYMRVALRGTAPQSNEMIKKRAPVNVALVLDRSGSMTGEKLLRVKEAAVLMLDRFDENDIVSVVTYDDRANVLVPAAKLTDRQRVASLIRGIEAGGSTALYAGMTEGRIEVCKCFDKEYVHRIVLLSDGLANVGPSSPEDLGAFGAELACAGITVTTIGVGLDFNEDLMTTLAARSDGNHVFAERPEDVAAAFFEEARDVTTVVAKNLGITLRFNPRVHPVRALGREVVLQGQEIKAGLNQLNSEQTKYVLMEVEIGPVRPGETFTAGSVQVEYADLVSSTVQRKTSEVKLVATDDLDLAATGENRDVMECVIAQLAVESNQAAMRLRDRGEVEQSRQALEENARWLRDNAAKYNSKSLEGLGKSNSEQAAKINDNAKWKGLRKSMSKGQFDVKQQTGK